MMTSSSKRSWISMAALCAVCLVSGTNPLAQAPAAARVTPAVTHDAALSTPESVGFSTQRLARLHTLMQETVDQKQLSGIVTILARHGKIIDYRAYGKQDVAAGTPMTRDTIFRAFSMTKPVTAVAMMLLYEQGKWLPTDPIAKYIPEFAQLKVLKSVDSSGQMVLEDSAHAPTMQQLMSHTAGFTYGFFGDTAVDKAYQAAGVDALFMEVHEDPARAKSDASNALRLDLLEPLLRKLTRIERAVNEPRDAHVADGVRA